MIGSAVCPFPSVQLGWLIVALSLCATYGPESPAPWSPPALWIKWTEGIVSIDDTEANTQTTENTSFGAPAPKRVDGLKMVDSGGASTLFVTGTSLLLLPLLLFNAIVSASGVSQPEGAKLRCGPRVPHESLDTSRLRKAREQKHARQGSNVLSSANVMKLRMKHLNRR